MTKKLFLPLMATAILAGAMFFAGCEKEKPVPSSISTGVSDDPPASIFNVKWKLTEYVDMDSNVGVTDNSEIHWLRFSQADTCTSDACVAFWKLRGYDTLSNLCCDGGGLDYKALYPPASLGWMLGPVKIDTVSQTIDIMFLLAGYYSPFYAYTSCLAEVQCYEIQGNKLILYYDGKSKYMKFEKLIENEKLSN